MHLGTVFCSFFFCIKTNYLSQLSRKKASLNGNATQLFLGFAGDFLFVLFPLHNLSFKYSENNMGLFIILKTGSTVLSLSVPFNVRMMEKSTLLILVKLTLQHYFNVLQ